MRDAIEDLKSSHKRQRFVFFDGPPNTTGGSYNTDERGPQLNNQLGSRFLAVIKRGTTPPTNKVTYSPTIHITVV